MTKDIDVSKIDVGWRVQLDTADWALYRELMGEWVTIIEKPDPGRVAFIHNGQAVMLSLIKSSFLAALPPEPAKDPFAVGEWVVAIADGKLAKSGDILRVDGLHLASHYFVSNGSGFDKASFRPATPEEIAAHLEKTATKGCEPKVEPTGRSDDGPEDDGKITFTVAGREFFVGQRVWNNQAGGMLVGGEELEVIGANPGSMEDTILVRKPGTWHTSWAEVKFLSIEPPPTHEWCIGDICHGEDPASRYIILKVLENGIADIVCVSSEHPILYSAPVEWLTFIRRTNLWD